MKFLKLEKRKKISYVSFTRTRSLNALNSQTLRELINLNKELDNDANTKVTVNGELKYNSNESFNAITGDPTSTSQWLDLRRELSGINFFDLATEALIDFTGCATGYQIVRLCTHTCR